MLSSTTGRSPPRIPGAEGPVEVVDYGHGEDKNKRPSPVEDPWAKNSKPDDPWARDSRPSGDHPWDRNRDTDRGSPSSRERDTDRFHSNYSREHSTDPRDSRPPFSRDTRGLSRGTTDSPRPMRDRDPWDRDDRGRGRDTNRDWRDRSPVRDRDMRERDRDRRRERDRFRPSPQNDQSRGKSTLKRYFTFKKR